MSENTEDVRLQERRESELIDYQEKQRARMLSGYLNNKCRMELKIYRDIMFSIIFFMLMNISQGWRFALGALVLSIGWFCVAFYQDRKIDGIITEIEQITKIE